MDIINFTDISDFDEGIVFFRLDWLEISE